jgi:hypothetical protein
LSYHRAHLAPPDRSVIGRIGAMVTGDFAVQRLEAMPGEAHLIFAEAMRGRDTLLYVHGFNQSFEASARDSAQLADGIAFAVEIIREADGIMDQVMAALDDLATHPEWLPLIQKHVNHVTRILKSKKGKRYDRQRIRLDWPPLSGGTG